MIGVAMLHLPTRVADALARFARRKSIGDLSTYGLPVPEEGPMTRLRRLGVAPAIVDSEMIETIKSGGIEIVPAVDAFAGRAVRLAGGSTVEPDAVICATGYRRGLERLVGGLDVLDEHGRPRADGRAAGGKRPALHRLCPPARRARLHGQAGQTRRQGNRHRTPRATVKGPRHARYVGETYTTAAGQRPPSDRLSDSRGRS